MTPVYIYRCEECEEEIEKLQPVGADAPICCGKPTNKLPTFPAMVKWKGEGGFPSRRRQFKDKSRPHNVG